MPDDQVCTSCLDIMPATSWSQRHVPLHPGVPRGRFCRAGHVNAAPGALPWDAATSIPATFDFSNF
ncbi:hypothetical protein [Bradyrhizobium oligotrophicum]|uniref:hypothetical protein n=1 Tax=Bradyrhizobium oligotrophicum TaxID=44255 RepID=UPI00034B2164|nr:hypothetical protein [Bradyrhizobium oligotrophicum]